MTIDKTDTEFSIYIRGITYVDAVTLCSSRLRKSVDNWHASDDDDGNEAETGTISIPVKNIRELATLLEEIEDAESWADEGDDWEISLHATRIMPTYNLTASLTETGGSLLLMPVRPANAAVAEALSRMQLAIADARAAACLLEGQP